MTLVALAPAVKPVGRVSRARHAANALHAVLDPEVPHHAAKSAVTVTGTTRGVIGATGTVLGARRIATVT